MSKDITIGGETFTVSTPYDEGHTLTAIEAKVLNQVRAENIGNNFRKAVKDAQEKGPEAVEKLREDFAKYDADYTFAAPGAARVALDPVEREAIKLARAIVREKLAAKGLSVNKVPEGYTEEQWAERVESNVEAFAAAEAVVKQAKANVASRKKLLDAASAELELA